MIESTIELLARHDVPYADRQQLLEMERTVDWGTAPGVAPMEFGGGSDWLVLVRESGRVVSKVGILERQIRVDATELRIAGIAGVMTAPAHQGRGYASAAMRRAEAFLNDERDFAFALLVCWPSRVPFYERLSWRTHPGQVVCEQTGGRVTIDRMRVMVLDGRQCPLPAANIDLLGLPW